MKFLTLATAAGLLLILQVLNTLIKRYRRNQKATQLGCESIPTEPTKWPFGVDLVINMAKADKEQRTPDFIVERFNRMGRYTWRAKLLGQSFVITADSKNIQAILATQFNDFRMGRVRETNLKLVLGRSIFTVDGEAWHSNREMVRPIFSRENVSDLALLERHLKTMFECMPVQEDGWTKPVSLASLFPCLTIDSATELFLGKSTNSLHERLSGKSHHEKDFHWAFERVQQILGVRIRLQSLYWIYGNKEIKECVKILNDFCDKAMEEADLRGKDEGKKYHYLDVLRSRAADSAEVREQVLGLLAAGRDTTASLLSWVFYCLIRNQRVFEKLRSIVIETFGHDETTITFEKLRGCTYLQHVMNETLRLHSIVPFNGRTAVRDTTLPTGGGPDGAAPVFIPAGAEVRFSTHVLQRRHDLWGPDAEEFIPERWEKKRPGWQYAPFNGGPRICIGQLFALTEAGHVIVRMLQKFEKIEGIDVDPSRDYHHFTLVCSPGPGHESVVCKLRAAQQ
ncbi:Cytochrome P450 monooxygenase [Pseudocercospora fuligena]|uniref:Cytochrome P450 monooxygenase n=1 Tax=Pseudocercospora fuligena TaxID=685502 RepID=A0A8H6RR44_9PEZI|nr:Cytochrome P450 monooxygenase [Pseudocercospora fuligena]